MNKEIARPVRIVRSLLNICNMISELYGEYTIDTLGKFTDENQGCVTLEKPCVVDGINNAFVYVLIDDVPTPLWPEEAYFEIEHPDQLGFPCSYIVKVERQSC